MDIVRLDQNLFLFINSFVGKSPIFDGLAKLLVNEYFIPTTLSLLLFSLWFYWEKKDKDFKQKKVLAGVLGVGLGSLIITSFTNALIQRPRPFDILDTNLLFYKPTDPSFPSNATVVVFALATAVYIADKKIGLVAIVLAAFYGFLRVFVGIHFPSDIIVGAFIGIISVVIVNLFDKLLVQLTMLLRSFLKAVHLEDFS